MAQGVLYVTLPSCSPNPILYSLGSTMEAYEGLTDKELIARLKKYSIPHGPLVGMDSSTTPVSLRGMK